MSNATVLSNSGAKRKRKTVNGHASKRAKVGENSHHDEDSQQDIALLEEQINESNRYLNNIVLLLRLAKKEIKLNRQPLGPVSSLCRVFCRLIAGGRLSKSSNATEKEVAVTSWLKDRYGEYKALLLHSIEEPGLVTQNVALGITMQLVQEEHLSAISGAETVGYNNTLHQMLTTMLTRSHDGDISRYFVEEWAQQYDDMRHQAFRAVVAVLGDATSRSAPATISNCLEMMGTIDPLVTHELTSLYCDMSSMPKAVKPPSFSTHRKQAQKAWLLLMSSAISKEQRKAVLGFMTQRVLPWIQGVEVMMDFLSDSYNAGGASSLLALSGLFHLMQEKNLDYPDFYTKLYSLLDEDLLYSKHRSRFFRLLDIFLASTHLPAVLVASFVKKLSRLCLHAPPTGIVAVVPWVYNMLKSHPTCTFLVHREPRTQEEREELEDHGMYDPFDAEQKDPMLTEAIESCLWELETLQSHYHPNVASLAKIMSEQFTKASYSLEDFLDHSYGSLLESELSRELKKAPVVEFEIPKTIFTQTDGDATLLKLMQNIIDV